jgi:threonine dehydratase
MSPATRVYGAEPEVADDTRRSLVARTRVGDSVPDTIADGLQAPTPGRLTFDINLRLLEGVLVASESEIVETIRFMLMRQKVLVEPSGAVALAAVIRSKETFRGNRVGVVLSGGNVDWDKLRVLLA